MEIVSFDKDAFRQWIEKVQEVHQLTKKERLPQTRMSKELGYNEHHISRILGENGVVTEEFVNAFRNNTRMN